MTSKILKHPSLVYASDITEICRPLSRLNIGYFAHAYIDNFNQLSGLNNNAPFMEHYIKNKYYNADIHMAAENKFGQYVIWDDVELIGQSAKMDCEGEAFGIKHTFTIIEKEESGTHYFHFANNSNNKMTNLIYLSNLDLLKTFLEFFKEKIKQSKQLSNAYDIKFSLNKECDGYATQFAINFPTEQDKSRFLQEVSLSNPRIKKRDSFNQQIDKLHLSKREKECLYLFVRGKSGRIIAKELYLSSRTVETHLAKIKTKLNVASKAELIDKVYSFCLKK